MRKRATRRYELGKECWGVGILLGLFRAWLMKKKGKGEWVACNVREKEEEEEKKKAYTCVKQWTH